MKNSKLKVIIIDVSILIIVTILLMAGIYTIYEIFPKLSRLVATLIIFCMIPISWITIIFSIIGKKTIGYRIIEKLNICK